MKEGLVEAIAWLRGAEALLDQAHSNLRAAGLDSVDCGGFRKANVRQLMGDVESLRKNIEKEAVEG